MWSFIIVSVCMFGADARKCNGDAIKQDELQGTWSVVSVDFDGKTIPTKSETDSLIVFKGNELLNILEGKPDTKATFVIDVGKKPKRMEITFETPCGTKEKAHAIYDFKRDGTLRLAFIGEKQPATFETKPGSPNRVLNLKRVKPRPRPQGG